MYKIESVWSSGKPFEFTNDKGQLIKLVSYFLEVVNQDGVTKVYINQKPESKPPVQGDSIDLEISAKTNQKGTHFKAKKKQQFPDLVCFSCGATGPLEKFKPKKESQPEARPAPDESQAPQNNVDDIPF